MSAIVSGTAAPIGSRWAYSWCLLLATMLGCAAEVADQGALDQSEAQDEVGVVTQALGATVTVRTGLGDRPNAWSGNYGVWITSGADCKVTPFKVHRVKLSDGALQTTNLGCRPAVRAAVSPNGTVHVWIGGSPGALSYHAILTVNGAGFTKRIDTQGSVHGMAATDTQIFWADDLGVRSMNSDGSSPQTLFSAEDTFVFGSEPEQVNLYGIDNGLLIFGAIVDSGTWLAIGEMWTNGLFPFEQFRMGGNPVVGLSWDNDNYYFSFESGSINSFSRWPGEGFTDLYDAPAGYTLGPGLDDSDGNLYFLRRNTATGKTDILRRSSNGAVTIQKTDVGTFYLRGLYTRGAYLYWSNTTGTLKKSSLP